MFRCGDCGRFLRLGEDESEQEREARHKEIGACSGPVREKPRVKPRDPKAGQRSTLGEGWDL